MHSWFKQMSLGMPFKIPVGGHRVKQIPMVVKFTNQNFQLVSKHRDTVNNEELF